MTNEFYNFFVMIKDRIYKDRFGINVTKREFDELFLTNTLDIRIKSYNK